MSGNNKLADNLCIRKMKSFLSIEIKINNYDNAFFGVGEYVSSIEKYRRCGFNYYYYYY
jgi:hypothetical protein